MEDILKRMLDDKRDLTSIMDEGVNIILHNFNEDDFFRSLNTMETYILEKDILDKE